MDLKPLVAAIRAMLKGLRAVPADATEHSYRTPIELLLQTAAKEYAVSGAQVIQESQQEEGSAPDFKVSSAAGAIGYAEHKRPGTDLDAIAASEQIARYGELSDNLLLTDGLRWMRLRGGDIVGDARIAASLTDKAQRENIEETAALLRDFIRCPTEPVGTAKELAQALATPCASLRDFLREAIEHGDSAHRLAVRLRGVLGDFRKGIVGDLDADVFVDAFAQTLVYGLFLARLNKPSSGQVELANIDQDIPPSFPLLRDLSVFLRDLERDENKKAHWIVRDIVAIVNQMDLTAMIESLSFGDGKDDPYIYFYEEFLKEYNPELRQQRGVYYTPPPVVRFIVGAVETLLQNEFGIPRRFADSQRVTVLDFAAGTGTFMVEVMRRALAAADPGMRDALIRDHILKNIYGFEYLIAPYAVAHLKISQFLRGEGYNLDGSESAQIYLTNTLVPINLQSELAFLPELGEEAKKAQQVKDNQILAIIGNPPYSGHSQNKGDWIAEKLRDYYRVDGQPLGEKNPKWLQDDYVKFIRFAQWKMESVERGIVAIITNHAFLDNPTFRGMRQSLMRTFNRLYFLDLHGNAKKKERAPDGGKDENVFDIQQGVAVSIMVKMPEMEKEVYHADLRGERKHKQEQCSSLDLDSVEWKKLSPSAPHYLFVPQNKDAERNYRKFCSVADIFLLDSVGIVTARDQLSIHPSSQKARAAIFDFANLSEAEAREKYKLGQDSRDWKVALAQKDVRDSGLDENRITPIAYRPFDTRYTYYTGRSGGFICRPRPEVMRHLLDGNNLALISVRQVAETDFTHVFVSNLMAESRMTLSNKGICYVFPLYRYLENGDLGDNGNAKSENIAPQFRRALQAAVGFKPSPEDILGYVYAVLHAPAYRQKYADFLRYDFPRVPMPPDAAAFRALAKIGGELIAAHLLRRIPTDHPTRYHGEGSNDRVEKIAHQDSDGGRLYINRDKYFAPLPPQAWEFQIGGYQPLKKYLQARKGRELGLDEINRLSDAANAIAFTIAQMRAIDDAAEWI